MYDTKIILSKHGHSKSERWPSAVKWKLCFVFVSFYYINEIYFVICRRIGTGFLFLFYFIFYFVCYFVHVCQLTTNKFCHCPTSIVLVFLLWYDFTKANQNIAGIHTHCARIGLVSVSLQLGNTKILRHGQNQRMFQVLSIMHCINDWYLNFKRCTSEQQPLKTVGKMEFWNWNNLEILRGEFTFDFIGQSSVKMNVDLPHIFMVKIPILKW